MYLHAEVVLNAISGLAHFRITRFEVSINHLKQYRSQFVTFQKMPEIQYRGLVRQSIGNPAESRKAAHALGFVQGIFHLPVEQVEPILQAVDAKHTPQRHRLTAPPPSLRVMRFNVRRQHLPGYYPFHFA